MNDYVHSAKEALIVSVFFVVRDIGNDTVPIVEKIPKLLPTFVLGSKQVVRSLTTGTDVGNSYVTRKRLVDSCC